MAVALGIDIEMESGAAQKAGPLGASASSSSRGAPASGAESFRRNWQSLLASLGVTEDGGNAVAAGGIDGGADDGIDNRIWTGESEAAGKAALVETASVSGKAPLPVGWLRSGGDSGGNGQGFSFVSATKGTPKSLFMQLRAESAAAKPSGQTELDGLGRSKAHSSKGEHTTGEASHGAKGNANRKDGKTPVAGAASVAMNVPVPVAAPVAVTNAQPKAAKISDSHPDADLPGSRSEIFVPLTGSGASAAMSRLRVAGERGPAGKGEAALLRKMANEGQGAAAVGVSADPETDPEIDSAKTVAAEARPSGHPGPVTGAQSASAGLAAVSVAQARLQTGVAYVRERSSAPGEPKPGGTNAPVAAMAGGRPQSPDAGAPAGAPVSDASSSVVSTGTVGGKTTAGQVAVAAAQVSTKPAEREKRVGEGQTAGTGVEASTLGRDPGGTRGIANSTGGNGGLAANAAFAPVHDTFAALDAGTGAAAPNWVHAGAQHAEAGFQDPSLGWVSVRANVSGGAIHAALVPGSPDAAQMLAGHLAGLNGHLAAEHLAVQPVTVAAPSWSSGQGAAHQGSHQGSQQGSYQGSSQGSYQGSYSGAGRNSGQGGYAQPQAGTTLAVGRIAGPATAIPAHAAGPSSGGGIAGTGGAYISVIA